MDFIDWCDYVLDKLIEATESSLETRSVGLDAEGMARLIFGEAAREPGFHSLRSTSAESPP